MVVGISTKSPFILVVEYSSPVWNPSKKQQISQVEQIQRKTAWYVFNDYRDRSPGAVTNKSY
jgi:hypothetical protein